MIFCSLVIAVSSRTPRPGATHPDHSAPGLGSCLSLTTPSVRLSPNYFRIGPDPRTSSGPAACEWPQMRPYTWQHSPTRPTTPEDSSCVTRGVHTCCMDEQVGNP